MYCINCGEQIPENADFCPNCGKVLKKEQKKVQLNKKNINIILNCIGIILGITLIILSVTSSFPGEVVVDKMYGGDAYTGMQNAMAAAANNLYNIAQSTQATITAFGTVSGLLIIVHYLKALVACTNKN